MRKNSIAVILVLSIVIGLLSGCKKEDVPPAGCVTRGQWISMLAEAFGWESHQAEPLAYSDVTAADPLFPSVQAAAGWGALAVFSGERLEAEKAVTRREVAGSAALAAGFLGEAEDAPAYAAKQGLIDPAGAEYLTAEECASVIKAAQAAYLDRPREKSEVAILSDDVVDLRSLSPQVIHLSDANAFFSPAVSRGITTNENGAAAAAIDTGNGIAALGVGDIFITAPTPEYLGGKAYKVTEIGMDRESGSITITGETPAIGEIYDELHIHTTVSLDDPSIVWADGVTAAPTANERSVNGVGYHVELLGGKSFSGSYQHSWHKEWGDGAKKKLSVPISSILAQSEDGKPLKGSKYTYTDTPSISDFKNSTAGWKKSLTATAKYDAGYKITGDISLSLEADVDTDYSKYDLLELWPEETSISVRSSISASLKLEGTFNGRLEVGEIPIPIANTGLFVTGGLYIHADATGALQVGVEFKDEEEFGWSHSGGYQHVPGESSVDPTVQGTIDATFGPGMFLQLEAFGIKIVGAELAIDGNLKASGAVIGECEETTEGEKTTRHYTEAISLSSSLIAPIINITISGPDHISELFGWTKTFTIDHWAQTYPFVETEWVFWEAVTTVGPEGEVIESQTEIPKGENEILADLQSGDFSYFAGTYKAAGIYNDWYGGGEALPDLVLDENGAASESDHDHMMYAGTPPTSVTPQEDGSYLCQVLYFDDAAQEYYLIYPEGKIGPNPYVYNDPTLTSKVYIQYVSVGGGVSDIIYIKSED